MRLCAGQSSERSLYSSTVRPIKTSPPSNFSSSIYFFYSSFFFFFQAEDGIRDYKVTGVQTCALPIFFAFFVGERVTFTWMTFRDCSSMIKKAKSGRKKRSVTCKESQAHTSAAWLQIGRASCRERV